MSRGGLKITTHDQQEKVGRSAVNDIPDWMKNFAKHAERYLQSAASRQEKAITAVEVVRDRQPSIHDQIYAIMNGKRPLYSSVEEAVIDYQKKTGLSDHLKKIQAEKLAMRVIAASEDTEKKTLNSKPSLLDRHEALDGFITNMIDTNYHVQIPAVLHSIGEVFGREISAADLNDPDLARYINKKIMEKGEQQSKENYSQLGRGIGTENSDENRDPFTLLRPS